MLSVGSIFLAAWIISAAIGPSAFADVNGIASAWYGLTLMFFWSLVLFYHLCNGVRHMIWDTGTGLNKTNARVTGYITIGAAAALTVLTWIFALAL